MADKNSVKQLKIKTGILRRTMKDHTSYKKEETQLNEKLQKMIEEGKEEHDIMAQQKCISETTETLATCKPRIQNAIDDLENTIATFNEQEGELITALKDTQEWSLGESTLAEGKAFIESLDL